MGLRAGLTGRKDCRAGFPGLHPGLVELALQAGVARGAFCERGASGLRAFRGHVRASSPRAFRITHPSRGLPWFPVFSDSGPRVCAFLVRLPAICVCGSVDEFGLIAVPAGLQFRPCCVFGL